MTVSFQLPTDLEANLRGAYADVNAEAKEAFLVSLYRQRRISHVTLSRLLNVDRFATEQVLHKHNVTEDLGTLDDYLQDARVLESLASL
jgi:predicted HTH domain antitoxin